MLLVEKLPQPAGLIVRGEANAGERRLQLAISHRVERRETIAVLSGRPEPVSQL
jgi:hypothetical protein